MSKDPRADRLLRALPMRALLVALALIHLFPVTKHLGDFCVAPSWSDGWKGFGAVFAATLLALPAPRRSPLVRLIGRRAWLAQGALLLLVAVHVVPASDHVPKFLDSPSWADGWRAALTCTAVSWFAVAFLRRARSRALRWLLVPAFGALLGCGGSSSRSGFVADADGGSGGANGGSGTFGAGTPDGGASSGSGGEILLYAHTDTTLYSLDPANMQAPPKVLGKFDCLGSSSADKAMTDLAVSKDGKLYAVSASAVYPLTVGSGKVHCDATWPLPSTARFYGLTFAPENTVAATEVLIAANNAGELYQVDANTGHTTEVGTLGQDASTGTPWALSGDIVFLANGGSPVGFATVRSCSTSSSCSTTDTLIEVDVHSIKPGTQSVLASVRGPVEKGAWCTNSASPSTFGSMFGIAAFQDKVYGFSRKGDVVEIHNDDGSACLVASYATDLFAGAGVTTTAPIQAPPPK